MSEQEFVDGFVPFAGKLLETGGVPPVRVEFAVGKSDDLGVGAEYALEDEVKNQDDKNL
jgi:hypothetical protein